MGILIVKRYLPVVVLAFLICLIGADLTFAAVGEIGTTLQYNSKFAPPLKLPDIPGGLSVNREYTPLLELNYIERAWLIETPYSSDYVYLTLFAGGYQLYNTMAIKRDKYTDYVSEKGSNDSWLEDMAAYTGTKGKGEQEEGFWIDPNFKLPEKIESIIGEGGPRINVSGSRKISFSGRSQWDDLPETGNYKQSKFPSLHMEQTSRFKIKGQIGSKVTVEVDQDSNRDVDIANTLKLRYTGYEDEIIQTIEAGNTTLSLPNSEFIGFSQSVQGLFGIKATAKIGNVDLTVITSQEKGSNEKSTFSAGAQSSADTIWDYQYLNNVYFYLSDQFISGDELVTVKLYTNDTEQNKYGLACVNPINTSGTTGGIDSIYNVTSEEQERDEVERCYFQLMEQGSDYYLYKTGKYIVLNSAISDGNVLAAYFEYVRNGDTLSVGNVTGDTLVLKLIQDRTPDTSFTTWDLEWKNVYYLGSTNISSDGFVLDIYKGIGDIDTDTLSLDGDPFIELFGFDQYNNSDASNTTPDGLFDFNTSVPHIDPSRGHLIFPQSEPFIAEFLADPNPAVYNYKYSNTSRQESKKYYIHVETSKRASTFSLGKTNIIEGSEVVKMSDGTVLTRGTDYTMSYEIGQITFLNQDALSAAADLTVDFEYAPYFMPEKKSLLGVAAEYQINENSAFSISGMYRNESTDEYRPRVGQEPKRWFIWDSNLLLHFEPEFLTDAIDALPLIETDASSTLEFSGELAQNVPNPNTRNIAYIDDFESSRQATDLVMRRGTWTRSSRPVGTNSRELDDRRELWWYNPYNSLTIEEIWPEKSVESSENQQDVLFLEYFPDTTYGTDTEGWAGIMRSMYTGLSDQSKTKFIEIWYFPDTSAIDHPTLYIDVGNISEDLDEDGYKDTEDRDGDGVFEEGEDTGLDTLTDDYEWLIVDDPVDSDDPSGDNWYYSDVNDYSQINGTEGNRQDPDRFNRIDTEDINSNGALDVANSFFQYEIDLNYDDYLEEETSSGWRLLRIPFQDSTSYITVGSPDNSSVNYIRLWITGVNEHYLLKFANIDLVGNKWQELSEPEPIYMNGIPVIPTFEVSVINSQENAASYESPPGVAGEYDKDTGIQEKEQSLVLQYDNFYPGQRLGAYWMLSSTEDYTLYNRLKMYVHGDEDLPEDLPVEFFFRMGTDSVSSFYEYRTKLYPGWDERNWVNINFSDITGLKAIWEAENESLSTSETDITSGNYRVKGTPSLATVKMFVIGIEFDSLFIDTTYSADSLIESIDTTRIDKNPIAGQLWVDELRLSEIRKKSDFAGRFSAKVGLADLGNVTLNFSRTGSDFYTMSESEPPGKTTTTQSASGKINVDKFFPPSWGLSLPVSLSWSRSLYLPRLETGSDVVLPEEMRDDEKTENRSWSITLSEGFNSNTNNWLVNWTINRINTRYVFRKQNNTSPTTPVYRSTTFEFSGSYDLTPKSKPSIKPFNWTKALFLPKSIYDIEMFYLPTTLKYEMTVDGTKTYTKRKSVDPTSSYTKEFTGKQSYAIALFSAWKADFTNQTYRDISDPELVNLSLNPSEFSLGKEETYSQTFNTSFTPKISKLLSPRVTYNAKYSDNSDLARNTDSTRTTDLSSSVRGDITLDVFQITGIKKFLGTKEQKNKYVKGAPPPDEKDKDRGRDREREKENEPEEEGEGSIGGGDEEKVEGEKDEGSKLKIKIPNPMVGVRKVFSVLNTVKPVKATVSSEKSLDRAGLYFRPGWMYTLGFVDDPDVLRKDETTYTRDQITRALDYSFQSGATPLKNLDFTTSYSFRQSVSRSSSSTEPTQTESVEFPKIDANLSNLHSLPIFNRLTTSMTLQSNFTRKVDETGNPDSDELSSRTENQSFSPLAGISMVLVNGVKVTIRYTQSKKKVADLRPEGSNRTDYDESKDYSVSFSYSFSAPQGINLPILGRFKFSSQLTVSVNVDRGFTKSWFVNSDNETTVDAESDDISITPKMTYRFSAKVTGGINATWTDTNDKIQDRKRHVRELGIWTELRF